MYKNDRARVIAHNRRGLCGDCGGRGLGGGL